MDAHLLGKMTFMDAHLLGTNQLNNYGFQALPPPRMTKDDGRRFVG